MRATFYCCCSIVSFGQFKQDQADKLRFLVMILSVTQTNKLSNEVGILDKNSSSFLFKKKNSLFLHFAAFEDAFVKEKETKSSHHMQQVFIIPSLLFTQDFVFMLFMCVYITYIYKRLSRCHYAIMSLCR